FSQEALALDFAAQHADKLRYVDAWGKWLIWDGTRWRIDETLQVFSMARELCRATAATSNATRERKELASAKTRAAVVALPREDHRLVATKDQWDTDPWLLNTPKGTMDLRTGKLHPHNRQDYITKVTAFTPEGDCPQFKTFINDVTANDGELAKYLQRSSGYA